MYRSYSISFCVQTNGAYKKHSWTDHIAGQYNGHLAHLNNWTRHQNATWISGGGATVNIITNGGAPDDVAVDTLSAQVLQLHEQYYAPHGTSQGNAFAINDFTTPYLPVTDFNQLLTDSLGNSMSGTRFNFVIWGIANGDNEGSMMINAPSGSEVKDDDAIIDLGGYADYTIPREYQGVGFLIARITFRHQTNNGGTWTLLQNQSLLGNVPNVSAGGGSGGGIFVTEFLDSDFRIQNTADVTKQLAYDISAVSTSTIRTITAADVDINMTPGTGSYASNAQGLLADSALQDITNEPLGELVDVSVGGALTDQILSYNGSIWVPVNPPASASGYGDWDFDNGTATIDPGNQRLALNNAVKNLATEININNTNSAGTDMATLLSLVGPGDAIYLQDQNDSSVAVVYDTTSSTDNGGWFTFGVTFKSEAAGGQFSNNQAVSFVRETSSSGSGVSDHTALTSIGINTHDQIDSHINDSTIHFPIGDTWNPTNDGSGSGLDADLLDVMDTSTAQTSAVAYIPFVDSSAKTDIGRYLDFHNTLNSAVDFNTQLSTNGVDDGELFINGFKVWHSGNDGSGSGLDADTLTGVSSSQFLRNDQNSTTTGTLTINSNAPVLTLNEADQGTNAKQWWITSNGGLLQIQTRTDVGAHTATMFEISRSGDISTQANTIWHAGNDGSGSGLDADLLDGIDSTGFATSTQGGLADSALQDITNESIKELNDVFSTMTPNEGDVLTYNTSNGWQSQVATGGTSVFGVQFNLATGTNGTYTLDQSANFNYTVDSAVFQTLSGTITADVRINNVSITGLNAMNCSSVEGTDTATAAKTVAPGDKVTLVTTSDNTAINTSIKLQCTRT